MSEARFEREPDNAIFDRIVNTPGEAKTSSWHVQSSRAHSACRNTCTTADELARVRGKLQEQLDGFAKAGISDPQIVGWKKAAKP